MHDYIGMVGGVCGMGRGTIGHGNQQYLQRMITGVVWFLVCLISFYVNNAFFYCEKWASKCSIKQLGASQYWNNNKKKTLGLSSVSAQPIVPHCHLRLCILLISCLLVIFAFCEFIFHEMVFLSWYLLHLLMLAEAE